KPIPSPSQAAATYPSEVSMRTLVTGGAGFIGSHLCERLLARGDEVVCVDNFVTGQSQNLAILRANRGFQFVQADVIQPLDLAGGFDEVYHLASPASPPGYLRKPLETALVNSAGTNNALA